MTINQIETIVNKVEGSGTFAFNTPLVFRNLKEIVNTFDWSTMRIHYSVARVIFTEDGLYYVVPVLEVKQEPTGIVGDDYDIVDGKFYIYMKPDNKLSFDILSTEGIWAINIIPKMTGGIV